MEAIESAPRNLFESPTNPPQPPATHSVVSAADSSELKCSCGWTFRPRKSGSLAQEGPGKQSEAAWSRHTAVVSADYADYEYSEKVFSMVQNATEAKSGGQTQKIVEAYSVLWKTFFDCVVRWKREFAEEVPRPHLLKQSVEIFVQLATMNFRVSFAEMQQLRGFLPYNEVPLLRQLHLKSPYGAFRLTTQDTSASIRAQLSGQPENEGLPLYIMLEGVKDLPPMPANVTAQTEMEAVRKEHTSLLLRDSQTVKELERRLCELEFLCERLEQLERSPNAGVYKGRKGDGIETIGDYKDLIKLDMDQLAEELDNLIDSEEAEEHKSDKDGTFVDDRSRPASASNGKSSASSAKQGRSREKRKTRKTEKAEESEKYEDYERYDEDDDDDEEVVKPEKKAKSPRTPKQSSKAKSPASAPPVHHPGATKPATGLGVRRTEYTAYEPKGTPAAAGPVSMPNQGDRQMLSKLAQESMSAGKQGARAPEEEAVAAPSLYAARGIVFHRGGTAGIYYHLTGYAALFAVLFRHSSITADNPLRSGLEESMRPWRFDFNAPDDLLRRVYSSEPPNSGPLARPNGAPFQYLRGKAEVEEVVSELLRRLPIALLQAVYDLLSNPALAPFFASWDPLVQEYAEYFHVRLWVDLRHLHKPCFHVYARNQVEMAMRLLQQGHDIGLLLFTDQKPARVASYDCVGDLRRAAPWSRQCEACEMLGRYLGSLQQQQQDPTAQHR